MTTEQETIGAVAPATIEERWVGPPGTGKSTRCAQVVEEAAKLYSPQLVLVCSLTRSAAAVVAQRVTLPRQNVSTLHSHAHRSIGSPEVFEKYKPGFAIWITEQGHKDWSLSSEYTDSSVDGVFSGQTEGDELFAKYQLHRLRMGLLEDLEDGSDLKAWAILFEVWKRECGFVDFVDQIRIAYDTVETAPGNPAVIVVDEAQDMSKLEWALVRKWGARAQRLVVVGDPAQALYAWRGADPESFFAAPAKQGVLDQSYRVPRAAHGIAVGIIKQSSLPNFEYKPRDVDGSVRKMRMLSLGRCRSVVDHLMIELDFHLSENGTWISRSPDRQAMLLTTCNYQLLPLIAELRRRGILWHNPYRLEQGYWNPLSGARSLRAFLAPQNSIWGDAAHLWTHEEVNWWADPMQAKSVFKTGAKADINTESRRGAEPVTMIEMSNWMTDESLVHAMDGDVAWWFDNFTASAKQKKNLSALVALAKRDPAILARPPQVIVGTIHSVKGGEADSVYVFPDLSTLGWREWREGDRESIIRQFYVAVTRTREDLILCGSSTTFQPNFW